jgi:acetyl-CoA carboxylase biotin carboxyl carrier protein
MAKKPTKSTKTSAGGAGGDLDLLKELVKLLDDHSSVSGIKLARGDASYEVSRMGGSMMIPPMPMPMAHHGASLPSAAAAPSGGAPAPAAAVSNLIDIKSPMVGTFYRAPEPGAEPYVKAGSRVAPGQTLCIIEAMKIMNEIECEVGGTIRELLVEDQTPVEFGQVLYRVEPNA